MAERTDDELVKIGHEAFRAASDEIAGYVAERRAIHADGREQRGAEIRLGVETLLRETERFINRAGMVNRRDTLREILNFIDERNPVMVTFEQAATAKLALRSKLGRPDWLRGIGVSRDDESGHFIKVNVAEMTPDVRECVPREFGGVPVQVEEVGKIVARPKR